MTERVVTKCFSKMQEDVEAGHQLIRELTAEIRTGSWDLLVVDTLTTLSRQTTQGCSFVQEVVNQGVRFVAVEEGLDIDDGELPLDVNLFSGGQ